MKWQNWDPLTILQKNSIGVGLLKLERALIPSWYSLSQDTKAQTEKEAMAMYDMTAWEIEFVMFGFDGLCQFNRWIDCCLYLWNEFLLNRDVVHVLNLFAEIGLEIHAIFSC